MDGFHVKCMTKDKRNGFPVTQIGQPVPDEHAFDGDDDVLPVGLNGPEKRFRIGFKVFVKHGVAFLIQDTDVHGSGVQIDAAIILVLLRVESHRVSSFWLKCFSPEGILSYLKEEAFMSIKINTADRCAPAYFFVLCEDMIKEYLERRKIKKAFSK